MSKAKTYDLDFNDLEEIQIPVHVKNVSYILKEASGAASTAYRNAVIKRVKFGPDGKAQSLTDIASVEALLISHCLFDAQFNKPVPAGTIEAWPNRIKKRLFETAKEISELSEEDETEESLTKQIKEAQEKLDKLREEKETAGNEPSDTTDG
jgi:hypothetical protein